jgi:hypothetical protein
MLPGALKLIYHAPATPGAFFLRPRFVPRGRAYRDALAANPGAVALNGTA